MKNYSSVVNNVNNDWEMGVCEDHLEFVSNLNSGDHVTDGAADGTDHCISLLLLKPHSEFKSWFL